MTLQTILALTVLAIGYNIFVYGVYWWDKRAARNGDWRVQEKTLLLLAFTGGGAGALAAQRLLRHKTRKPPFNLALPLFLVMQILLLVVAVTAPDRMAALLQRLGDG
jgi:uncharacterized membrane protein YsdA (DUF1294 family)